MTARATARGGFTLIEVLACLLIFTFGALAVIGLMMYGISLAGRAHAASTGMETARTMVADDQPIGMRNRSVAGNVVSGILNGYFVIRTAVFDDDFDKTSVSKPRVRVATITAEVFLGESGTNVAILRQRRLVVVP